MLVGSNMLIFGDDNHPAVSLKLRDASQPINVLTGIDDWYFQVVPKKKKKKKTIYWNEKKKKNRLDNLMCNVPEVAMCYHLNGIVQVRTAHLSDQ